VTVDGDGLREKIEAVLMIYKGLIVLPFAGPCSLGTWQNTGTTPANAVHLRHVRGFRVVP